MKKYLLFISIISLFAILISGCGGPSASDPADDVTPNTQTVWSDVGTANTEIILSDGQSSVQTSNSISLSNNITSMNISSEYDNYAYLRSSGVEFWYIDKIEDIDNIRSVAGGGDTDLTYDQGNCLYYPLPDRAENIYFVPDENTAQDLSQYHDMSEWTNDLESYKNFSNILNMIRFDVGGGKLNFVVDGEEIVIHNQINGDTMGLNANSLFFIDKKFLKEVVYVKMPEGDYYDIEEIENEVVKKIVQNSIHHDNNTPIDVAGGLFIPFDPISIQNYDPSTDKLSLEINWDMKDAIYKEDGQYYMADRIKGTCFDFTINFNLIEN